jgi:predicted anti-sigma-YlaC factor YlaD
MPEPSHHITCQALVELVSDYLEQALESGDAELFEQHLVYCEGCEHYVEEVRRTIALSSRLRDDDVPAETVERLLTEFRQERTP